MANVLDRDTTLPLWQKVLLAPLETLWPKQKALPNGKTVVQVFPPGWGGGSSLGRGYFCLLRTKLQVTLPSGQSSDLEFISPWVLLQGSTSQERSKLRSNNIIQLDYT